MMGSLLDRKLLFVTGKGGVGKSTVAASLGGGDWLGCAVAAFGCCPG